MSLEEAFYLHGHVSRIEFDHHNRGGVSPSFIHAGGLKWYTNGSSFVGRLARRSILNEWGETEGGANGRVVGWLPSDQSDYVSVQTHRPAPLWHMIYDDEEELGEEDLEDYEVIEAVAAYEEWSEPHANRLPQGWQRVTENLTHLTLALILAILIPILAPIPY